MGVTHYPKDNAVFNLLGDSSVKACCFCHRYLEGCGDAMEDEGTQKKLKPVALSCMLNTAACQLKLQQWQDAIDNCNEVGSATRNPGAKMVDT